MQPAEVERSRQSVTERRDGAAVAGLVVGGTENCRHENMNTLVEAKKLEIAAMKLSKQNMCVPDVLTSFISDGSLPVHRVAE